MATNGGGQARRVAASAVAFERLTLMDATSPGVRADKWVGDAQGAKGEPLRVTILRQSRDTRTLLEAVVAPAGGGTRYGAALAALLLSPSLAGP